jgi:hypothetical protein
MRIGPDYDSLDRGKRNYQRAHLHGPYGALGFGPDFGNGEIQFA